MNIEMTMRDKRALMEVPGAREDKVREAAATAAKLIAPLWPLRDFVAVNPALGFTGQPFEEAAAILEATSGAKLFEDRAKLLARLGSAGVSTDDLDHAIRALGQQDRWSAPAVLSALEKPQPQDEAPIPTVADVIGRERNEDWASFVVDQVSAWAAGYLDDGQAIWGDPFRQLAPYSAWRKRALIDRSAEMSGVGDFRSTVGALPGEAEGALCEIVRRLDIPAEASPAYFHRLLRTVPGWAGFMRYRRWSEELAGGTPSHLIELIAIRAAYDLALFQAFRTPRIEEAWHVACRGMENLRTEPDEASAIAQTALELHHQDRLVGALVSRKAEAPGTRPEAQAVFCIDVRSERMRRALETADPALETLGFAGFFGFALKLARPGEGSEADQCPVLLMPGHRAEEAATASAGIPRTQRRSLRRAWKSFKLGAVSSFAFVESWAPVFGWKIARDVSRRPARADHPLGALYTDLSIDDEVATAAGALRGMSLERGMARLVALVGHGSTTTNNPYAAGLDCGACGGHTGEANARVAAAVLNKPEVRERLAALGIEVPDDTVFVAGLHDTTTDEVRFFDTAALPSSHLPDLTRLEAAFRKAGTIVRQERAQGLGITGQASEAVPVRSRDWAETRPEWGLAGCASFIAAPRQRTRGVDLGGRAFLHSYDWRDDDDNAVLELIMTAPLVVASWISLQYYGSSVDNRAFGSGDKTLHNVTGGLGVLEGYGGDLRSGLPLQSVHDGEKLFHEPLRLAAFIEAPTENIDAVLGRHPNVRDLFDHGWLHLVAITDDGKTFLRRTRAGAWKPLSPTSGQAREHAA